MTRKTILFLLSISVCLLVSLTSACNQNKSENSQTTNTSATLFNTDDKKLLNLMRDAFQKKELPREKSEKIHVTFKKSSFPKTFWGVAISIYNPSHRMIRTVITKGKDPEHKFRRAVKKTIDHLEKKNLSFNKKSRVQLDFIIEEPKEMHVSKILETQADKTHFEYGVDGAIVTSADRNIYFMPGDAYTHSVHSAGQFLDVLQKKIKSPKKLQPLDYSYKRFNTKSFIGDKKSWHTLYRGAPVFGEMNKEKSTIAINRAISHILKYQKDDGRFMYYYDTASDSHRDHEHKDRDPKKNPYYNILRHAGGGIALLDYYVYFNDKKVLPHLDKSIEYLLKQMRTYTTKEGKEAGYIYYNKKAKLGGTGLALLLLSRYQLVMNTDIHAEAAKKLATHLLSQIQENGEFYYYSIYLNKEINTPEENKKLFNFYYPGEAISGLSVYLKTKIAEDEKRLIEEKIKKAMNFLLTQRPTLYQSYYLSLPADSWLMMGIDHLWDFPHMRDPRYIEFVFNDADQMVNHMYTKENAPFPDYVGSFYYEYNQSSFPDGARAEGLTAALHIAQKIGDKKRIEKYTEALERAAWATHHLVNTPEAIYFAKNPQKALGGIRFKTTRQWFRIDTIQHVICFYMRFYFHKI